jgi:hypothetical protein
MRLKHHAKHRFSNFSGFGGTLNKLDTATFATPTGMNLSFNYG